MMESKDGPEPLPDSVLISVHRREEACSVRLHPLPNSGGRSSANCRAYAVTWIYAFDTPHGGCDSESSVDLLRDSIDNGDIEPMTEEMWAAFRALAVCYLDVLLDCDRASPEHFGQAGKNDPDNLGVITIAAYVGAAKFALLGSHPEAGVRLMRRVKQVEAQLDAPGVRVAAMENILWASALVWRGWRSTAAGWLQLVAERFSEPAVAQLARALPLVHLDSSLSRGIPPAWLALILVSLSRTRAATSPAVRQFLLGGDAAVPEPEWSQYVTRARQALGSAAEAPLPWHPAIVAHAKKLWARDAEALGALFGSSRT